MKLCFRFLVLSILITAAFALSVSATSGIEDMWTVANRIIIDVYNHIARNQHGFGRAHDNGLRRRHEAVEQSAEGRSERGLAQAHMDIMGDYQRHRRVPCICAPAARWAGYDHGVSRIICSKLKYNHTVHDIISNTVDKMK